MKKKQIPIVMAAFGTTSRARETYTAIDTQVRDAFPGQEIHWAFSSRLVKGLMQAKRDQSIKHPHQILRQLQAQGHDWAVVQSVHLLGGHEFFRLLQEVQDETIRTSIGMPLLTSPDDYLRCATCLAPMIDSHPDKAILLVGHGTDHPAWTAYPALEQTLRKLFGDRIFVGAVEKFPPSDGLIAEIAAAGFREALLVPFLLVAGNHYRQDLMGKEAASWISRLREAGIAFEVIPDGIGRLPCIGEILCDHIREALEVIPV
ncbi:MAG: sirohydrochlorin cobaltochelatase [Desulfocapsaceae bacterium]|nr:sirohydrochlorin cobaltochelatase [Desulfocapsaceae bacterium]